MQTRRGMGSAGITEVEINARLGSLGRWCVINFVNTDFSLNSIFKTGQINNQCILCDNTLSGVVAYHKVCKEKGFKTIVSYKGGEIYLARNKEEYKGLLDSFSGETRPSGGVHILGTPFGELANLVTETYWPYLPTEGAFEKAIEYIENYGDHEIHLGICPYGGDVYEGLRELLRDVADHLGLPTCLVDEVRYSEAAGAVDHRIIACHRTKKKVAHFEEMSDEYKRFFLSDQYYPQDWSAWPEYTGTQKLVDSCEEYDILSEPKLPYMENATDRLTQICREGWKKKKLARASNWEVYRDRVKEEIDTIKYSGFSTYFLILHDLCKWIDSKGWLRGFSRGSAGGSLVSYLMDITKIDPIVYNLLFERFYSISRNTHDHVSFDECSFEEWLSEK
jgi:DNA polymerase III alpha subunit